MAFSRSESLNCYSAVDERAAAFMALGMGKMKGKPAAVVCTSGSALANIYPAVLEAYYMQAPLLVISADRPPEYIDRWDGQAIRQNHFFGSHIQKFVYLEENREEDKSESNFRMGISVLSECNGPVHVNMPLSEPLYGAKNSDFFYPVFEQTVNDPAMDKGSPMPEFNIPASSKLMVLIGASDQQLKIGGLGQVPGQFPVLCDLISNTREIGNVHNWESLLLKLNEEQLKDLMPDVLITFGKMVLNKTLRNLLRKNKPSVHVHVEDQGIVYDPFFTEPTHLKISPQSLDQHFFEQFNPDIAYFKQWTTYSQSLSQSDVVAGGFSELLACRMILNHMNSEEILHLSNSMSVRNAAYNASYLATGVRVYANRGVSGIDGCTSTALGAALADSSSHVLITGDLAFLYDVNAFFTTHQPANLTVFVVNNHGGGIFYMIDGPSGMPELNTFVGTPHTVNIQAVCAAHGVSFCQIRSEEQLSTFLKAQKRGEALTVVELLTDIEINTKVFKKYKEKLS